VVRANTRIVSKSVNELHVLLSFVHTKWTVFNIYAVVTIA